ncbi:hypothetical protein TNCV_1185631 [Trichonephila clavipes]|nr:hypothetical protein TNCV_1185631 [Trichonephila clavipes]
MRQESLVRDMQMIKFSKPIRQGYIAMAYFGMSLRELFRIDVFGAIWYLATVDYRRGGSGRPRNTNDREDRAIRRDFGTNNDSTPLTSFQISKPKLAESRHYHSTDFCRPLDVTDWRRIFSDESRFEAVRYPAFVAISWDTRSVSFKEQLADTWTIF